MDLLEQHSLKQMTAVYACVRILSEAIKKAANQIRTGDLILTKDALYLLSYISTRCIKSPEHRIE